MYKRIQKTVLSFMTNTKIQGLIDFGKLVGDNAPMCPTW